jgi:L-histidine N-alpha-methyltransferase
MDLVGLGQDFSTRLALPPQLLDGPALVFYPGSSIGNFSPDQALRLLREARATASGGALLIGVDLVKDTPLLEAAYDDELGVTAAFNLNLLSHLNRLLGADFRVRDWQHLALFDPVASRIEMHLQARHATTVRWAGGERHFLAPVNASTPRTRPSGSRLTLKRCCARPGLPACSAGPTSRAGSACSWPTG